VVDIPDPLIYYRVIYPDGTMEIKLHNDPVVERGDHINRGGEGYRVLTIHPFETPVLVDELKVTCEVTVIASADFPDG